MESTFISIHDLSFDARVMYVSDSISDILDYSSEEVIGKSYWEYFHRDEIPVARAAHAQVIRLDKAAVLSYHQIKSKSNKWIDCECVSTVVYDVIVACTTIYRRDAKSQKRAVEAFAICQLFSSSPGGPQYHTPEHLFVKSSQKSKHRLHEPRAALFLNRFTRTLTIMYATNGLAGFLNLTAEELKGKSFYYCIQEICLPEAVKCLESAKANNSIAYLRFWYSHPRPDDRSDHDEITGNFHSSERNEYEGAVHVKEHTQEENNKYAVSHNSTASSPHRAGMHNAGQIESRDCNFRSSSADGEDLDEAFYKAVFDHPARLHPSLTSTRDEDSPSRSRSLMTPPEELEAVISCTSDALVIVLRRAKALPLGIQRAHH